MHPVTLEPALAATLHSGTTSPASPTTSCAASSRGDDIQSTDSATAPAAQAPLKPEPRYFGFAAYDSQIIWRKSAGSGAFKPYEARGVLKTEDVDASSSCYSSNDLEDQASPRTASSPPTIATVLPPAAVERMQDWAAAHERDQTFEMFTVILSAAASLDLKTAALNQLLHLSATSSVAQEVISHHEGLYELLLLHIHGCLIHSYLATAVLRHYGNSSTEAKTHLQKLSAVLRSSRDLQSDLAHLPQLGWIAVVQSCNLLCVTLRDAASVRLLLKSGCMSPLINLLRSISSTKFHFEASFEASAGAARVIAASICLLHIAAAFSEEATDLLVQAGLIAILLESPVAFNGPDAEPVAANQLLRQLIRQQSRTSLAELPRSFSKTED